LIDLLLRQNKNAEAMAEVESAIVDFGVDKGILAAALKIREHLGPMRLPPEPKSGGSVSLCVITKNEEHRLARCLASAKPFADEIIVVDTGSIDATKDLAKAMGARVYDFEWEDDFSKARNFSLSKASGDWVLVLDADEAISPQDRGRFPALTKSVPTPAVAYCIRTRNYTFHANTLAWHPNDGSYPDEEQGVGWFPSEKVRLFPNHAGIRFSHPVHELVEPSLRELKIPIQACDIPVHHYGNLKEEKTLGKIRGYRAIGEKKLSHAPEEPAALRELAIQSSHLDRHAEAIDLWRRYLEKVPHSAEAYLNLGSACWQLGRYVEAREHAKTAQRLDGSLKEAAFNRALAELLLGKAGTALNILERLLRRTPGYLPARFILAAAYACSGKARKAGVVLQAIESTPLGAHLAESFHDLAKRLRDGAQTACCEKLIAAAMATGHADARFAAMLESIRQARTAA
jgi:tetratricopeptide (TPR) repeat protein